MSKVMMLSLAKALTEWVDMQVIVGDTTILARDFACYQGGGIIVKVDGEEPDGISNPYYSVDEIEDDLVKVVPGYVQGAAVWQEGEYEY